MDSAAHTTTMKIDLKNDYEAQIRDFFDSVSHSSEEIESFRMLQNDLQSIIRASNSSISDPPEETDSFEDPADIYMDKSVRECEPELAVCHKETSYNIIKDIICVDEGCTAKDKFLFGRKVQENICNLFSSWSCENKETVKDNIGINVLNPLATEETDKVISEYYQSKDLTRQDEDATRKLVENIYKEIVVPGDKVLFPELRTEISRPSGAAGDEIEHNHAEVTVSELHSQRDKLKNTIEDAATLELTVAESNIDILDSGSKLQQENGSITNQFDDSVCGTCEKQALCKVDGCNCCQTQNAPMKSNGQNQAHRSFSSISSRITNSGAVPYSGNISFRSDSSTASTRSFAFPILQSEWNSSPVRMVKPEKRHQGWKLHLFCCKF
ncbi:uncharacterized protein LOC113858015 isoform X2 [Abrus precatorius]|uniref:Uncharacterized protein LOC113858015 isoform X2 n=1 Tax=Abrus precatorius TaxID=3816 RepID=A0A8B8KUH3_ABRPR|nr:uncharacterized protein LOC113858015 isoform X2 [Abrus precatorius]